ncbi:MAG: GNAT family N-acetyltransferase [Desulfobacteraceae bacterium]|nr:GNAT family N-acetyltransferase [Desulfobacteraceae bacterium]
MPQLYIDEYTKTLTGKTVCIACRAGILWDHFSEILADLKFLDRQGIKTVLYHNIPNRFANQKYFRTLETRLPETRIVRVSPEKDFYRFVLDHEEYVFKLIFLERKQLIDQAGDKINALSTAAVRSKEKDWGDLIANVNFRSVLDRICTRIDQGSYDRVHILPAGKHAIKHELFTIEGAGTLIANNFVEYFQPVSSDDDVRIINGILNLYKDQGYLIPRTQDYLLKNRSRFFVTLIDGIVVGCVEKKTIDQHTVEIGALAISTRFRNQRVGVFTIQAFIQAMRQQGFSRIISLTNNPSLIKLYNRMGFCPADTSCYADRQMASPGVRMFSIEV